MKKNKGLKRGVWWEGYLASRANRRAQKAAEGEEVEEIDESEGSEGQNEAEAVLTERLERVGGCRGGDRPLGGPQQGRGHRELSLQPNQRGIDG